MNAKLRKLRDESRKNHEDLIEKMKNLSYKVLDKVNEEIIKFRDECMCSVELARDDAENLIREIDNSLNSDLVRSPMTDQWDEETVFLAYDDVLMLNMGG